MASAARVGPAGACTIQPAVPPTARASNTEAAVSQIVRRGRNLASIRRDRLSSGGSGAAAYGARASRNASRWADQAATRRASCGFASR